jgi:hypothetical protein
VLGATASASHRFSCFAARLSHSRMTSHSSDTIPGHRAYAGMGSEGGRPSWSIPRKYFEHHLKRDSSLIDDHP